MSTINNKVSTDTDADVADGEVPSADISSTSSSTSATACQQPTVSTRAATAAAVSAAAAAVAVNATSSVSSTTSAPTEHSNKEMKRSAVRELIERYFYQLQRGCGNPFCTNFNCASSGLVEPMEPNEIAAKAIQLFSQDAKLCDFYIQPPKVPRTQNETPTSTPPPTPPSSSSNSSTSSGHHTGESGSVTSLSTNTDVSSSDDADLDAPIWSLINAEVHAATSNQVHDDDDQLCQRVPRPATPTPMVQPLPYLDETLLDELINECKLSSKFERLMFAIAEVFASIEKLSESFRLPEGGGLSSSSSLATPVAPTAAASKLQELLGKAPGELKKEDLRTLEGENDKDEDSTVEHSHGPIDGGGDDMAVEEVVTEAMDEDGEEIDLSQSSVLSVDLDSLRRVKNKLLSNQCTSIVVALNCNVYLLAENIRSTTGDTAIWERVIHCLVICFDFTTNTSNNHADYELLERCLPKICLAAATLPHWAQARLARIWATHCKDQIRPMLQCCQSFITVQVILDEEAVQENVEVSAVTKVIKIIFYANILAGVLERNDAADKEETVAVVEAEDIFFQNHTSSSSQSLRFTEEQLEKHLNITALECRVPYIPFDEFYNEALSDAMQMDRDYLAYKNLSLDPQPGVENFSYMMYSFILTPASKVVALYYDSRIRMYSERNSSLYSLLSYFGEQHDISTRPDLKLKVRRDNLIEDALVGLELVAMSNPKDLKKQLVVEFIGEDGIDEGGVSKEFFQLIIEELFNPDIGMFVEQPETSTVWFNSTPFENDAQFTLIGIIVGLAIYNNVILAVNFPMVVYRKLMGGRGTFYDLEAWNKTLYKSLQYLLDYEEDDMEEVFMQTFKINYTSIFGEVIEHELKAGGGEINVCQSNKREFVELYTDFLLNKSIARQFNAFKRGFDMVTDESPLKLLFRPEEIEMLVCGSRKFDFEELEKSTEYEGGYTRETKVIDYFWEIVHSLPEHAKRRLLAFTTGSDRVPVGGFSRLRLMISRNGSDSDRLPTSHTCFNILLLPEYSTKEKLEERLIKAINYSKGFGML